VRFFSCQVATLGFEEGLACPCAALGGFIVGGFAHPLFQNPGQKLGTVMFFLVASIRSHMATLSSTVILILQDLDFIT
jgi:hypothetical protein